MTQEVGKWKEGRVTAEATISQGKVVIRSWIDGAEYTWSDEPSDGTTAEDHARIEAQGVARALAAGQIVRTSDGWDSDAVDSSAWGVK